MNKKGQSILSEYTMVIFIVIAAAVGMTIFLQRGFEARIHDARNYVFSSIMNNSVCDANCVQAAGGTIGHEYEPYYTQSLTDVRQNQKDTTGKTPGNRQIIGAIYTKGIDQITQAVTTSVQLPPICAGKMDPKPAYCVNFQPPNDSVK